MNNFDQILQNIREKISDHKSRIDFPTPKIENNVFLLSKEMEEMSSTLSEEQIKNLATKITESIIKKTGEKQHLMTLYGIIHKSISSWN